MTIRNITKLTLSIFFCATVLLSCKKEPTDKEKHTKLSVDYTKYELENGLDVILHQDKSDPIVSLTVQYGVGSNREKIGKTGFAHLFEHMLFQESENVGQDQFFKKIQDAGGTLNGSTWKDGTIYYELVPKNAMETIMWLESDRMGYVINTVTESSFNNQQEVVQNEKRERVDNNPYGHTSWVIDKNLYPEGHPYSWQIIGELVDLQKATVEDVHEFYDRFYGPNNATLVLAGDFEIEEAKTMIQKYFGEIKRRQEVAPLKPQRVKLDRTKRLYHEDNFAQAPQLTMVWPTVEKYTKDSYALNFLSDLLSYGKKSSMYKVVEKEKNLSSSYYAYNNSEQLAGAFNLKVTANSGVDLDSVEAAINESFRLFEKEGFTEADVERIRAGLETSFYNGISSILGKSNQLASYNILVGNPGFIEQDIENIKSVTKEDILRVYNTYIKGKPYVMTSFVPKGQLELITENSEKAPVVEEAIVEEAIVEEAIVENVTKEVKETTPPEIIKTPTSFDRSVQPEAGPAPTLRIPDSWTAELSNGIQVYGIEQNEVPTVNFSLVIEGGHLLDSKEKNGVANLITDIMMEGTATKTPEQLEEEIQKLGAHIYMYTEREAITIRGNTLTRNFKATMALVEEILMEPRWDEEEFGRIKIATINRIKRSSANPRIIAHNQYDKILYGEDHIFAYPTIGTVANVESITIDDLKEFYNKNFSPSISRFNIVGKIDKETTLKVLSTLENKWASKEVTIPSYNLPAARNKSSLVFVDVPNAKQSIINIGNLSVSRSDKDFYPLEVMNFKLGGNFTGNVNMILREEKGYTYGARTSFTGSKRQGVFTASSSVRTNTTGESVEIFRDAIKNYKKGIEEEDLQFTKNSMIKTNARRFETQFALLGMLQERSAYGLDANYIEDEEAIIRDMTLERHKTLANKYLDESKMVYLIVGDAATQYKQFKSMGFDEITLLDKNGKEMK